MLEAGGSLVWFLFLCAPASDYWEVEVEGGKVGWLYFSRKILLDALDDLGHP